MTEFKYSGNELDLFEHAKNWKEYWLNQILPFVGKAILEVGAGIGATAKTLKSHKYESWVCLEPDAKLCQEINRKIAAGVLPKSLDVRAITSGKLEPSEQFDTILYIDVLEHIEDDISELEVVSKHLSNDGNIIILSPAHNFLYTPFDKKIGHHRRYNKKMLREIIPKGMVIKELRYLDGIGLFASMANKLVLKTADPTQYQIQFWDRFMVNASRLIDPLLNYQIGKSILCIIGRDSKREIMT
jgi:2-polyprenyl-3-methyl-5-hydroxy-6-metoxy-1,4-benzoquinol methylase